MAGSRHPVDAGSRSRAVGGRRPPGEAGSSPSVEGEAGTSVPDLYRRRLEDVHPGIWGMVLVYSFKYEDNVCMQSLST